jgi:protein SCO1
MTDRNVKLETIKPNVFMAIATIFAIACFNPVLAKESISAEHPVVSDVIRTTVDYKAPSVEVLRQDGKKLNFSDELNDGRPIIMNFIFVSCSAICPMLSHVFSQVHTKLTKDKHKFHLVSISIDPENDSPAILNAYGKKFGSSLNWDFYTGTLEASIAIQKAFNAYRGDKMNHASVVLMRSASAKPWIRLEGFVSPDEIIREYQVMIGRQ